MSKFIQMDLISRGKTRKTSQFIKLLITEKSFEVRELAEQICKKREPLSGKRRNLERGRETICRTERKKQRREPTDVFVHDITTRLTANSRMYGVKG